MTDNKKIADTDMPADEVPAQPTPPVTVPDQPTPPVTMPAQPDPQSQASLVRSNYDIHRVVVVVVVIVVVVVVVLSLIHI